MKKHLTSSIFFLQGMFIFIRRETMGLKRLCFSTDFVCWLAKIANHDIKTMEKQKFWKPIFPKQKVIIVDLKKVLFCWALSGAINNSEFSLKNFNDDVTVNSVIWLNFPILKSLFITEYLGKVSTTGVIWAVILNPFAYDASFSTQYHLLTRKF